MTSSTAEERLAALAGEWTAAADLRGADLSEAVLTEARLETAALGNSPESGLPTTIDTRILDRVMRRRRRH